MISILLGCGLPRAEVVSLRKEDVQIRQGRWAIVDLVGKGWSRPYGSGACLGKERRRQVDGSGRYHGGPRFQSR